MNPRAQLNAKDLKVCFTSVRIIYVTIIQHFYSSRSSKKVKYFLLCVVNAFIEGFAYARLV